MINNLYKDVFKNKELIASLLKFSKLSKGQLKDAMLPDSGPELKFGDLLITDALSNGLGPNIEAKNFEQNEIYGT